VIPGSATRPLLLVGGLAVLLRTMRVFCRWDEWALHYAAYNQDVLNALQDGQILDFMTTWVGLHPPLYPMLHATLSAVWPAPILWLSVSALFSCLAVFLLLRTPSGSVGWLAALCLATDPVQVHYAAEVNNYPLMVGLIALAWWGRERDDWRVVAVAGVLGAWTHILAGVAIGLAALSSGHRRRILMIMVLGSLPLVPEVLAMVSEASTRRQPDLLVWQSVGDALSRFGPSFLILLPLLLRGCLRHTHVALAWGGTLACWWFMVTAHIAAPHQFPYALALGVPAALCIAAGCDRPWMVRAVTVVCLVRGLWLGMDDAGRLQDIHADLGESRAIDAAISATQPGDAIVLIRGLNAPDDDKRHVSPSLWRFRPWSSMPAASRIGQMFLIGQPRRWRDRVLYTFDEPHPAVGRIPEARVYTVLYDAAAMNPERVPSHPRQGDWHHVGADLWRGPLLRRASGSASPGASVGEESGE